MSDISTLLKLNGLICLVFGSLFIFLPFQVSLFLSPTNQAPELTVLVIGMILNLYGLFLLWIGKKEKANKKLILFTAFSDLSWVIFSFALIFTKTWITTTNGMTTAGLITILVGWFGWSLYKHSLNSG